MTAKSVLSEAARALASHLRPLGYRRSGLRFARQGEEVVSLIELQLKRGGTKDVISFVVNYGVLVPGLTGTGGGNVAPTYTDCHWGERLAGADGTERWWTVRAGDHPQELAAELETELDRQVLTTLQSMQSEAALIALWQTGRSPGLVEAQRLLFLGMLLHRAGRYRECEQVRTELESKARDGFAMRAVAKLRELEC